MPIKGETFSGGPMCVCVCDCVRVFRIFRNFLQVLGRDPRELTVTFISCQIQLNERISCL